MHDPNSRSAKDIVAVNVVPEPGQLVEVRRRQWVVVNTQGAAFFSKNREEQHLVTLASIDEDSHGEEIQVVWQIEPGAKVLERAGLPQITGVDQADRLDAFLDAVNWGATTNADRSFLQAPFRSGITIEDYQLDPLVRAVDMARVNLLIADDVGLGKTIEAGLVIQEMIVRHRARTVLVVCPASLQVKWKTEMLEKFGLEFRIIDTDYIKQLRRNVGIRANPWASFPRMITSMDWMKSGEGLRFIKDILPTHVTYPRKFDILLVDEAHNVAPAGSIRYALESQRTQLIRSIAPHFSHRLFLSATPHNGYQESFTSLLELLDDQRFARTVMPDAKQLQRVMIRRMKSEITDADGQPIFPVRRLECLFVDYTDEEREVHRLLQEFTHSRTERVKGTAHAFGSDFVHTLLKKRLFSSPMAFAITLAKHGETLEQGYRRTSRIEMDERILRKAIVRSEEDYSDDGQAEEAQLDAVALVTEATVPLSPEDRAMFEKLHQWAERNQNRIDSKAKAIVSWIEGHLKNGGQWNEKRVILFTEYRATFIWLQQILTTHGYGGNRLSLLNGSTPPDEREALKAAFQASPSVSPVRILLATDAASEGIDLQNHCNYLIHVEIPWNPNVMEQRNGRIDRHGQKEKEVFIWHPVGKRIDQHSLPGFDKPTDLADDHEYLMRAVRKVESIREDLGSVGSVIAKQIQEAMLGRRHDLDTSWAEAQAAKTRRFTSMERKLSDRIARLHERIMVTQQECHLTAENIRRAVSVALELAQKQPLKPASIPGIPEGKLFEVPVFPGTWGRATTGLEHPHTRVRRPITFDHAVVKGRDDVVLAHLNHPLVQMSLRLLREEIWKLDDVKLLHRVAVRSVADSDLENPAVVVCSRLVIVGGGHHRLHEELTLAGGEMDPARFRRIGQIGRLDSLFEKALPVTPGEKLFAILKERFERDEGAISDAVEARSRERLKFVQNTLARRKESEILDLMTVLDDLKKAIEKDLAESVSMDRQISLWTQEEKNQSRKDSAALRSRLAKIPEEKRNEKAIIEKHFDGATDRTFPVAVIFLVPRSMLGKGGST